VTPSLAVKWLKSTRSACCSAPSRSIARTDRVEAALVRGFATQRERLLMLAACLGGDADSQFVVHVITPARRAALRKAQLASAAKRRKHVAPQPSLPQAQRQRRHQAFLRSVTSATGTPASRAARFERAIEIGA
jgi:hypothetical protein